MRKKLIINFYLTYRCNLSCDYCEVYNNSTQQVENTDLFFSEDFLSFLSFFKEYDIDIELFWWEPLLRWKFIQKFYATYWDRFWYKITTNGLLLDDSFGFLKKILLSVHYSSIQKLQTKVESWNYNMYQSNIEFTYVIDKNNIDIFYPFTQVLLKQWFKRINILPVFWKYNWGKSDLQRVLDLIQYLQEKWFQLDFLWYENNKNDFEFSMDIEWNINSFTWEYIYNDALKNKFHIWNLEKFDIMSYDTLVKKFHYVNSLSDIDNAKICNVYGNQSPTNFLLLNKFLIWLKNKYDT